MKRPLLADLRESGNLEQDADWKPTGGIRNFRFKSGSFQSDANQNESDDGEVMEEHLTIGKLSARLKIKPKTIKQDSAGSSWRRIWSGECPKVFRI